MPAPKISKQGKSELLDLLRQRYRVAAKHDKGKSLDEFVAVAGCHRKHAIRLLSADPAATTDAPVVARRTYDEAVDSGWGREDFSAVTHVVEKRIGRRLSSR